MAEIARVARTFVDTNVLVYARDADETIKQPIAARWLESLWQHRSGHTSMQVLNEYYVTVTRKLRPGIAADDAWDDVTSLMAWHPLVLDRDVMDTARGIERRYGTSWWDATIIAAAKRQRCSLLLSEDFQHGMVFDQITIRSPFATLAEEASPAYAAAPAPRHRSRGRPARVQP